MLQAVREAARRKDAELRAKANDPDELLSLYRLGFELDERLDERFQDLKASGKTPHQALPRLGEVMTTNWNKQAFTAWVEGHGSGGGARLGEREIRAHGSPAERRAASIAGDHDAPVGCCAGAIERSVCPAALPDETMTDQTVTGEAVTGVPSEATEVHTRLLKCALEVEESRAYWSHADGSKPVSAHAAFEEYWFGARSLARVEVLLANMRVRYDNYPAALSVLHRWPEMAPDTRKLVCHWHLELADALYRRFTGEFLVERLRGGRAEVTRDGVVSWVTQEGPERWTMATRIQFASKLLSAAFSAGLVQSNRDPRPLALPRVPDEALEYLMYLLRGVGFDGSLLENPYAASVGLDSSALEARLVELSSMRFSRQGDLIDYGWRFSDLSAWADARLEEPSA